jgi:hypothetical protein
MQAPDGRDIPVPSGEVGLPNGSVFVRPDADVQIALLGNGYNVVVNNGDASSSSESSQLFEELAGEVGETAFEAALEHAFQAAIPAAIEAVGFVGGLLASILTTSHLTREVFIQAELPEDSTPVKYCLLVAP